MSIDMVWGAVKRFFGSPNKLTVQMGSNFLICSKVEGYLYLFSHKNDSLRRHSSVENAFDLDAKVSEIDSR